MTEWLWDTLLVSSLLVVAVLAVRRPVAKLFGPSVAYWLWLLPAARMFMPSLEREITAPGLVSASGSAVANMGPATTPAQSAIDSAMAAASGITGSEISTSAMTGASGVSWIQLAVIFWLGGAALIFLVQTFRYVMMRDALVADAEYLGKVDGVRLIASDHVSGPLAFGLFKRYIALPLDFGRMFSPEERELALAHEMAHHKSGDLFANLAAFIFLCLTWLNPLSWLAWNAFRFDQEAACDARVLEGRDARCKQIYGRTLAISAKGSAVHSNVPTFAMALNSPKTVIARLQKLTLKDISKNRRTFGRMSIFAAIGVALPLTATIVHVPVAAHDSTVIIKNENGKKSKTKIITNGTYVDVAGESETPFVTTIKKDGRTIVLRTDKELSQSQIDEMVEEAERSRIEADRARAETEQSRAEAEEMRARADDIRPPVVPEPVRPVAGGEHVTTSRSVTVIRENDGTHNRKLSIRTNANGESDIRMHIDGDFTASMIPDIRISGVSEGHINCQEGHPVSTKIERGGRNGQAKLNMVICGKAHAIAARKAALDGLRNARNEVKDDKNMKSQDREKVLKTLDRQIRDLERSISAGPDHINAPQPPRPAQPASGHGNRLSA